MAVLKEFLRQKSLNFKGKPQSAYAIVLGSL